MDNHEKQERLKKAHEKKPSKPVGQKFGITANNINRLNEATRKVVSSKTTRKRPKQAIRSKNPSVATNFLIEQPVLNPCQFTEYPTPSWFRSETADVSVIVPLFKSSKVIPSLITSWDLEEKLNVEIIFVDDCCPDNSKDAVIYAWNLRKKQLSKPIGKIIYNVENSGFGRTCNVGAQVATGEYLVFLNADTLVTKNWLTPIIDLLKDETVGIVGNLQLKKGGAWNNSIDSAGSEWSWGHEQFLHIGRHIHNGKELAQPFYPHNAPSDLFVVQEREMVTGCCLGIRKELFLEIGGFNPNYKVGYWEDSDLCLTVREKGYKVLFQPKSKIFHLLSHTRSGSHPHQKHNKDFFFNKWVNTGRIDSLIKAERAIPNVKSILINRKGARGDVLIAAAVAPALKKKYPQAKITFKTSCPDVLKENPYINEVITTEDRNAQVYFNLDMVYEQRPRTNILQSYAEAVGVSVDDCRLFLKTTSLQYNLPEDYIVVHAGKTAWVGRSWDSSAFSKLCQKLRNQGHYLINIGTDDNLVPCDLDLRKKITVNQLGTVIKNAKLFIGIDSFPMHVAQTFDTPSVCFFGSVRPETRIISPKLMAVTAPELACLGCHHRKPSPCFVTNICETKDEDCVKQVTLEMMLKAVNDRLTVA